MLCIGKLVLSAVVTSLLITFLVISGVFSLLDLHAVTTLFESLIDHRKRHRKQVILKSHFMNIMLSAVKHQKQDLELKENVAYGPSKPPTVNSDMN